MKFATKATIIKVVQEDYDFNGKQGTYISITFADDEGNPFKASYKGTKEYEVVKEYEMSEVAIVVDVSQNNNKWKLVVEDIQ